MTFSQIQKYEKGSNRIGSGRLYQIALYLGVSPNYFFEGLDEATIRPAEQPLRNGGAAPDEISTLTEAFAVIGDRETRASVLALVKSLAVENQRNPFGR